MATEKHYYIAPEKLREKFLGPSNFMRVKSLVKAIQDSSRTNVIVELKRNNIIQFVITGGGKGVEKALHAIKYEFEKPHSTDSSAAAIASRPRRAEVLFLKEKDHKKLQKALSKEKIPFLLTEDALRRFDILTGASELRQFACRRCNRPWWTYVPRTKPVSSCRICHVRYDALARREEFGLGRYICLPCDHTFYARCEATEKSRCFKCQMLTGPPYINPRFRAMTKPRSEDSGPPPRKLTIINASTVHDSTGSTVATFLTEDLGPDIYVEVDIEHTMATQDYRVPFEDEPRARAASPDIRFEPDDGSDTDDDQLSTTGEMGDLEISGPDSPVSLLGTTSLELDSGEMLLQKRIAASDSSDSSSESDDADIDKMSTLSVQGSEPDSGIGTWSNAGSGSDMGTGSSSAKPSVSSVICDFKIADFPGIAFSKNSFSATITKEGGKIFGEGIKLSVPAGAVRPGDEVTISLQACIGGPFCLPEDDLVFMSPVYLIQPPFAFRESVTLSMNMFVKYEEEYEEEYDYDDFCFVTSPTKSVLNDSNEAQWEFRRFGSPTFSEEDRGRLRGTIELTHFCFAAFAGLGYGKKLSYCISLYKPKLFYPPVTHAIFSVTIHHEAYIEHLDRYIKATFEKEKFVPTSYLITFSAFGVSFTLPVEVALRQGYSLSSDLSPCKILKEKVDYPIRNKKRALKEITLYPPRIMLCASQERSTVSSLKFDFKVEGITEDITLSISLTPLPSAPRAQQAAAVSRPRTVSTGGTSSGESSTASTPRSSTGRISETSEIVRSSSHSSESVVSQFSSGYGSQDSQEGPSNLLIDDEPDFALLYNDLIELASEWEVIALNLGLQKEISRIEKDGTDVESRLRKVLSKWQAKCPKPYTWRTIIEALEQPSLGQIHIATMFRERIAK